MYNFLNRLPYLKRIIFGSINGFLIHWDFTQNIQQQLHEKAREGNTYIDNCMQNPSRKKGEAHATIYKELINYLYDYTVV